MKSTMLLLILALLSGCEMPHLFRPLRLYDLKEGVTLEVFLQPNSRNTGMLVSARSDSETFHGEYAIYDRTPSLPGREPRVDAQGMGAPLAGDFAETYGFGKESNARPAGTAVIVGNRGTVVDIVLYRVGDDLSFGDGVAIDNKGRKYRVFLSAESE
jgi:hypothetical protein